MKNLAKIFLIVVLVFGLTNQSLASVSRVQTKVTNAGGYKNVFDVSFDSSVTTGNLIVLCFGKGRNAVNERIDTITDGINTYTRAWRGGTNVGAELWYSYNVTGGSLTITVQMEDSEYDDVAVVMREYSGIETGSDPLDEVVGADDPSGYTQDHDSGLTGTTAQADELVVGCYGGSGGTIYYTVSSGFGNEVYGAGYDTGRSVLFADKLVTSTDTYKFTAQSTEWYYGHTIVGTFKEAVATPTRRIIGFLNSIVNNFYS